MVSWLFLAGPACSAPCDQLPLPGPLDPVDLLTKHCELDPATRTRLVIWNDPDLLREVPEREGLCPGAADATLWGPMSGALQADLQADLRAAWTTCGLASSGWSPASFEEANAPVFGAIAAMVYTLVRPSGEALASAWAEHLARGPHPTLGGLSRMDLELPVSDARAGFSPPGVALAPGLTVIPAEPVPPREPVSPGVQAQLDAFNAKRPGQRPLTRDLLLGPRVQPAPRAILLVPGSTPLSELAAEIQRAFSQGVGSVLVPTWPATPAPAHRGLRGYVFHPRGSLEPLPTVSLSAQGPWLAPQDALAAEPGCPADRPVCTPGGVLRAIVRQGVEKGSIALPIVPVGEVTLDDLARILNDGFASASELEDTKLLQQCEARSESSDRVERCLLFEVLVL